VSAPAPVEAVADRGRTLDLPLSQPTAPSAPAKAFEPPAPVKREPLEGIENAQKPSMTEFKSDAPKAPLSEHKDEAPKPSAPESKSE